MKSYNTLELYLGKFLYNIQTGKYWIPDEVPFKLEDPIFVLTCLYKNLLVIPEIIVIPNIGDDGNRGDEVLSGWGYIEILRLTLINPGFFFDPVTKTFNENGVGFPMHKFRENKNVFLWEKDNYNTIGEPGYNSLEGMIGILKGYVIRVLEWRGHENDIRFWVSGRNGGDIR